VPLPVPLGTTKIILQPDFTLTPTDYWWPLSKFSSHLKLTSGVCPKVTMHLDSDMKVSFELDWDPTVNVFQRKCGLIIVELHPRSAYEADPHNEKWVQPKED